MNDLHFMNDLLTKLKDIEAKVSEQLPQVKSAEDLKVFRARFVGKSGVVSDLLKMLGSLSAEQRPTAGKEINDLKNAILSKISSLESGLQDQNIAKALSEKVDITLPGRTAFVPGRLHPVTQIVKLIEDIFTGLGFSVFEGPEIESDYYNFEALNVPKDHPARDMQDTFYISSEFGVRSSKAEVLSSEFGVRSSKADVMSSEFGVRSSKADVMSSECGTHNSEPKTQNSEGMLLRTHTSPVQIHVMEKFKPPIRMIFPGAVYRRDADVTHSPMFHQVEGLLVDTDTKMSDLKGVLTEFVHQMFGEDVGVRFRPSFFPFTEPSAEVDIRCVMCGGNEPCRVCKGTGWLEVLGCGMVDPNVFKAVGYDPKKVKGFAFGMGVERLAMLKFGISDIRLFFDNDVRFLKQF